MAHQDVFLFHGSIEFNITLGRIDRAAAERAAREVRADQFIRDLPGGYGFEVAHGGANLSAGQAQLVSFARAVAADADLVVLDEATSAVDSMTEDLIEKALARIYETRTVVAVAHRLTPSAGRIGSWCSTRAKWRRPAPTPSSCASGAPTPASSATARRPPLHRWTRPHRAMTDGESAHRFTHRRPAMFRGSTEP